MISIESEVDAKKRFSFNRPFSAVRLRWGYSYEILPELGWAKPTICWLDYDEPLDNSKLGDIRLVAARCLSGSVLIVTLEAEPRESKSRHLAARRLEQLRESVGQDRVPFGIEGKHLAGWGTARAFRTIVVNEIESAIVARNGVLGPEDRVTFSSLFNFHYADGRKMLTVGGVFLNRTDRKALPAAAFSDLAFVRTGPLPYRIEAPILTLAEVRRLSALLPHRSDIPTWIPATDRRRFQKVYRYYPSFADVEVT